MLIAARPGLGTINHSLLTLHAARAAGLDVRAIVLTPVAERIDGDGSVPTAPPSLAWAASRSRALPGCRRPILGSLRTRVRKLLGDRALALTL